MILKTAINFGPALLLLFSGLITAQILSYPDQDCNFKYRLLVQQTLTIQGSQENGSYTPGVKCRWIFNCPERFYCRLRCNEVAMPDSEGCSEAALLVSHVGSYQLVGADKYCGQTTITAKSVKQRLTLGLITSKSSPSGRFKCQVTTESAFCE